MTGKQSANTSRDADAEPIAVPTGAPTAMATSGAGEMAAIESAPRAQARRFIAATP